MRKYFLLSIKSALNSLIVIIRPFVRQSINFSLTALVHKLQGVIEIEWKILVWSC